MKKSTTQKTPKEGYQIPIPTRDDVFAVLEKAAQPIKPPKRSTPRLRPSK